MNAPDYQGRSQGPVSKRELLTGAAISMALALVLVVAMLWVSA